MHNYDVISDVIIIVVFGCLHCRRQILQYYRDVENFFSMSDIWSDKLRKFARPNENMPDRI